MKKLMLIFMIAMFLTSCGAFEKMYDGANYESLTNERGLVEFYSGGKKIYDWKNAKVLYSDADSNAIFIKTDSGTKYIQDGLVIHLD